jgi:poly-gamma-glutamate capsule biosynthesis protein CapA/YwtB (metallophosphatase superfamily)
VPLHRRRNTDAVRVVAAALVTIALIAFGCSSGERGDPVSSSPRAATPSARPLAGNSTSATAAPTHSTGEPAGQFTVAFAGDVHFSGRVAPRLAADPSTVFAQAVPVLRKADLTMVNLETAITTGGEQQDKSFTFRAPPAALTALKDAGIDLATEANNHGADYGLTGLHDTLAAIAASKFPVIGIGNNAAQAYAPYKTIVNGVKVAFLAATQVQDETLANWTAGANSPGVASAFSPQLLANVRAAKAAGYVVIAYIHWGTEYVTCPNSLQESLAAQLAAAGAAAVIGTHAHVLQGAGWRPDGVYVAYGLSNYLWWMSFGNNQDDNGVLTLTFADGKVVANSFDPSHLDDRGVPVPATGAEGARILQQWNQDRSCTDLSAAPPR